MARRGRACVDRFRLGLVRCCRYLLGGVVWPALRQCSCGVRAGSVFSPRAPNSSSVTGGAFADTGIAGGTIGRRCLRRERRFEGSVRGPLLDDGGHRIDNSPIFSVQPRRITQPLQPEYCATARTPARELRRRKKLCTRWVAQNYPVYRKRVLRRAGTATRRFPVHRGHRAATAPRRGPRRGSLTRNPGTRPFAVATDPAEAGSDAKPPAG